VGPRRLLVRWERLSRRPAGRCRAPSAPARLAW
jgi:hypothetical protein